MSEPRSPEPGLDGSVSAWRRGDAGAISPLADPRSALDEPPAPHLTCRDTPISPRVCGDAFEIASRSRSGLPPARTGYRVRRLICGPDTTAPGREEVRGQAVRHD